MPVTIKEIAKIANVSRGTVDRALHKRGGVNPEVEERILAIAESLGYQPNELGKALQGINKKSNIGLLLPSIENPFFADLIKGAMKRGTELENYGINIILKQMRGYDPEEQAEAIDVLVKEKGINALAFTPSNSPVIIDKIRELVDQGIFVATVNADIIGSARNCFVGVDFHKGGRLAAGLCGLFNENARIYIVNGSEKLLSHEQRINGFRETIEKRFPKAEIAGVQACDDNKFQAYNIVRTVLEEDSRIDMIYVVGEGITGVCAAINEYSSRNIKVVCFDDVPHTVKLFNEGKVHATICQQPFQQGYRAIQACYSAVVGSDVKEEIILDQVIKIRECF